MPAVSVVGRFPGTVVGEAVWLSVALSFAPSSSSPALTATVWAVFQVLAVNVRLLPLTTVRSVPSAPSTVTVTWPLGSVASSTV